MKKHLSRIISLLLVAVMLFGAAPLAGLFTLDAEASYNIINGNVGDIITFGSYPQSEVTDNNTLIALDKILENSSVTMRPIRQYRQIKGETTYKYNDKIIGYRDVNYNGSKYRGVILYNYKNSYLFTNWGTNTFQSANGYGQKNTVYWFKWEPLRWKILDGPTGLVVCMNVIDDCLFAKFIYENGKETDYNNYWYANTDKSVYANNYEYSYIRDWLNDDFYRSAFTQEERIRILNTTIDPGHGDVTDGEKFWNSTVNDKIFLLSYEDMYNKDYGFKDKPSRMAKTTDYAACMGVCTDQDTSSDSYGYGYWGLRTPYSESRFVCDVYADGTCYSSNGQAYTVSFTGAANYCGVRPAMCINTIRNVVTEFKANVDVSTVRINNAILDVKVTSLESHKYSVRAVKYTTNTSTPRELTKLIPNTSFRLYLEFTPKPGYLADPNEMTATLNGIHGIYAGKTSSGGGLYYFPEKTGEYTIDGVNHLTIYSPVVGGTASDFDIIESPTKFYSEDCGAIDMLNDNAFTIEKSVIDTGNNWENWDDVADTDKIKANTLYYVVWKLYPNDGYKFADEIITNNVYIRGAIEYSCNIRMTKSGERYFEVNYYVRMDKTAPATIEGLILDSTPKKLTYNVGEEVSLSGMRISPKMSDGFTNLQISNSKFEVTNFHTNTPGTRTATIKYNGYSTTFQYTVKEKDTTPEAPDFTKTKSLRIDSKPNTSLTYKSGTSLDGLKVTALDINGKEIGDVTDKVVVTGYDSGKPVSGRTATVSYTPDGAPNPVASTTFEYKVSYAWWQWIIRIILLGFLWY